MRAAIAIASVGLAACQGVTMVLPSDAGIATPIADAAMPSADAAMPEPDAGPPSVDPCAGRTASCPPASVSGFAEGSGLRALDRCAYALDDMDPARANATLDALAERMPVVTLGMLLGTTNRAMSTVGSIGGVAHLDRGMNWESGDNGVAYWTPQGITGSGDGRDDGLYDGREVLAVSWYFEPANDPADPRERGVRITFIDMANRRYRHALLIEPHMNGDRPDFRAVDVHAGGIAWYGRYLYVVDTGNGFRVFDLERILDVPNGDGIGYQSAGDTYGAYTYAFVIPQVARYFLNASSCAYRFSSVSVDRDSDPPALVVAEWNDASIYGRIARWPLDPASGALVGGGGVVRPLEVYFSGHRNIQGSFSHGATYWLSCSQGTGGLAAHLYRAREGAASATYSWANGPEDLSFAPMTGEMWSLTEITGQRRVFSVRLGDYD